MTREEFIKKMEIEKIETGEYLVELDHISNAPFIIGCVFDEGLWKIYKSNERLGHYIIKEFEDENRAFDYFYAFLLNRYNRYYSNDIK